MSMWLSMVRVSEGAFAEIQKNPKLLDAIFFDEDKAALGKLGIEDAHSFGVDYLSLSEAYEAMAEATGEEVGDEILEEDLGPTQSLDYDAGYGPAFFLEPSQLKAAAEQSMIPEIDEDAKRVFDEAKKNKNYLIGVIS